MTSLDGPRCVCMTAMEAAIPTEAWPEGSQGVALLECALECLDVKLESLCVDLTKP